MPPRGLMRDEAERLCKEFPDTTTLALARRLAKDFRTSVESGRTMIRTVRGASGNQKRKYAKVKKEPGVAGQVPSCPPSFAVAWEKFVVKDCKRVGVMSDVHIPYHSEVAFSAAVDRLRKDKVDTLLLNGDFVDFYRISRWQQDPRKRRFSEERKQIIASLEWIRKLFPKQRIIWKDGNHEERLNHFVWNRAPELYDLPACQIPDLLEFARMKIEYVTDQRPVMLGKLPVLHGHEMGKSGISSPVNPARGVFLRTMHTVLVGHGHRTSTHVEKDMFDREVAVWSTGCLCAQNPEYMRVGKQNWGFAEVEVSKDGSFGVQNLRVSSNGEVRTA